MSLVGGERLMACRSANVRPCRSNAKGDLSPFRIPITTSVRDALMLRALFGGAGGPFSGLPAGRLLILCCPLSITHHLLH